MTIYTAVCSSNGAMVAKIQNDGISLNEYFAGYDFMGSANWTKDGNEAMVMSLEEAEQIADDLTAAADPEETEAQPDPVLDHLQMAVEIAYADRNNAYDGFNKACEIFTGVDNAYNYYQQRQSFYEGVIFAINAAGYRLESVPDSDKLRVVK